MTAISVRYDAYRDEHTEAVSPSDPEFADVIEALFLQGYVSAGDPIASADTGTIHADAFGVRCVPTDDPNLVRTVERFIIQPPGYSAQNRWSLPGYGVYFVFDEYIAEDVEDTGLVLVHGKKSFDLDAVSDCDSLPSFLLPFFLQLKSRLHRRFTRRALRQDVSRTSARGGYAVGIAAAMGPHDEASYVTTRPLVG